MSFPKTTSKKHGRDNNGETPHRPNKKLDHKLTPIKVDLENMEGKQNDDALNFVDKIWPLLGKHMNTWLQVKLAEVVTVAATDPINKFVLSEEFKTSLKESIGCDINQCIDKAQDLNEDVKKLAEEIQTLKDKNDDLEQYQRRNNLRIHGIQENESENTDTIVKDLVQKDLGFTLNNNDICRSHRVGRKRDGKHRQIILKLTRHNTKVMIMRKRKELQHKRPNVFVSEDLTKERMSILKTIKTTGRHMISKMWTIDGVVFIRRADTNDLKSFTTLRECKRYITNKP